MTWPQDGREEQLHQHLLSLPKEGLQGHPEAVLAAIDTYERAHARLMTFKPAKIALARAAMAALPTPPRVVVELGTYVGCSAVGWGSILKDLHAGSAGSIEGLHVFCLEMNPAYIAIATDTIRLAGLDDIVEIVPGAAADSLRALHASGRLPAVDVLFLDHFDEFYLSDLRVCEDLGLLHPGSLVLADNMDRPAAELPPYLAHVRSGGTGAVKYQSSMGWTTGDHPQGVEISHVV